MAMGLISMQMLDLVWITSTANFMFILVLLYQNFKLQDRVKRLKDT